MDALKKVIAGFPFKTFLALLLFLFSTAAQAKPPYIVVAYLATTYDQSTRNIGPLNLSSIPWNDLTHLYCAFGIPDSSGNVTYPVEPAYNNLITTAHSNQTRVYLSCGGASVSTATWSSATAPANLSNLVNNIMSLVDSDGFDGVDIDWEFPQPPSVNNDKTQFTSLMQSLASRLHAETAYDGKPKGLTFFVSAGYDICGVDWGTVKNYADYGIESGYDYYNSVGVTVFNGPVSAPDSYTDCAGNTRSLDISGNFTTLQALGWPLSQMILGCPLYVDDSAQDDVYSVIQGGTLLSSAATVGEMESVYRYGGGDYGTDDRDSFCRKINWAVGSLGLPGISLWELSQAYPPTDAPVSALWNVIGGNDACLTFTAAATPTGTATSTPSATPTFTPSSTATLTPLPSATGTPTSTPSKTPTPTDTSSSTGTPSATPTSTPTFTPSNLPTSTPTPSPTPSASSTATATAAMTASATPTSSPTPTASATSPPSSTPTWTGTPSPTSSPTLSPTFTFTASGTPTSSPTPSASSTATATPGLTATSTFPPTPTSTPSPAPSGAPSLYPNPWTGSGPIHLILPLAGSSDVQIRLFTTAFRKVLEKNFPQVQPGEVLLFEAKDPDGTPLADGLYYVVVKTSQGRPVFKLLVLR